MGGKLRRCGHALSFVPWAALLSLGLLVGGLTLVAIKGMAAADAADQLIQQVGSNVGTGFPRYMTIFRTSVWAMVGVAGAGVAALVLAASVRLDQKLRKAGKYRTAKGSYSPVLFNFYGFVDWVGLILAVLLALWVAVAGVMLASWAAQCWNLSEVGAPAARSAPACARASPPARRARIHTTPPFAGRRRGVCKHGRVGRPGRQVPAEPGCHRGRRGAGGGRHL